jgi:hypothetical protein
LEPELQERVEIPLDILPGNKQVKIGDTIWLSHLNHNAYLINSLNLQQVSLDNKGFIFDLTIHEINFKSIGASFDFIPNVPSIKNDKIYFSTKVGCSGPSAFFQIGIIPRMKGSYILRPENNPIYKGLIDKSNLCNFNASIKGQSEIFFKFSNSDIHKEILMESSIASDELTQLQKHADNKSIYLFTVIE